MRKPGPVRRPQAASGKTAFALMLVWLGLLVAGVSLGRLDCVFLPAALVLNLLTFFVYWMAAILNAVAQGSWVLLPWLPLAR